MFGIQCPAEELDKLLVPASLLAPVVQVAFQSDLESLSRPEIPSFRATLPDESARGDVTCDLETGMRSLKGDCESG